MSRVLCRHRLIAAGDVDDAQPGMPETNAGRNVGCLCVRTAVMQGIDHPLQKYLVWLPRIRCAEVSGYATHRRFRFGSFRIRLADRGVQLQRSPEMSS